MLQPSRSVPMNRFAPCTLALALAALPAFAAGDGSPRAAAGGGRLGTVDFPTSCSPEVQADLERGLALLHHMMYEEAALAFDVAAAAEPSCGIAYWGKAMTFIHPLWLQPVDEAGLAAGRRLVARGRDSERLSARERAYLDAVGAYYLEAGDRDESTRLQRFAAAWRQVYERFPDDPEAACFHALGLLATASPADKSYEQQRWAGGIAERVLQEIPDHPAGHHYLIHAYDSPPLAQRALAAARNYGTIAPDIPHPLHMPTHIFTRLGLWQESIDWNRRAAVAGRNVADPHVGAMHQLHALDYLVYAYLQRGEDEEAKAVVDDVLGFKGPVHYDPATAYTFAAAPVRYALERRDWQEAALLNPRRPTFFPWDDFPQFEALTWFGKALGAARSGDAEAAAAAIETLADLRGRLPTTTTGRYWRQQVDIQRKAATAWLLLAQKKRDAALAAARQAAAVEATTEKHPVTPGEVVPAAELLGDMLLELGQAGAARKAYEQALERSPNRFNALYGAGRAAELAGDREAAGRFYRQLTQVAVTGAKREGLRQAKAFLTKGSRV